MTGSSPTSAPPAHQVGVDSSLDRSALRHRCEDCDLRSIRSGDELVTESLLRLAAVNPCDIGPEAARSLSHDDYLPVDRVDTFILAPGRRRRTPPSASHH